MYDEEFENALSKSLQEFFESRKFRMGVEYNLIPETDLQNMNGAIIGTTRNSYAGVHLGFYIGGGKWGR